MSHPRLIAWFVASLAAGYVATRALRPSHSAEAGASLQRASATPTPTRFVYSPSTREIEQVARVPGDMPPVAADGEPPAGLAELHADVRELDPDAGQRWPRAFDTLLGRVFAAVEGGGDHRAPCFVDGGRDPLVFHVEIALDSASESMSVAAVHVLDEALSAAQQACVEGTLAAVGPLLAEDAGGRLPTLELSVVVPFRITPAMRTGDQ